MSESLWLKEKRVAQTIPSTLPSKASERKKGLFAVLKRLPADVLVYFEPVIDNRDPDFVVVLPTLRVLLFEVKGWYLPDIIGGDTHSIRVREGQREVEQVHPLRQAAEYKYRLMDFCKRDKQVSILVNPSGPYAGNSSFRSSALLWCRTSSGRICQNCRIEAKPFSHGRP
jgi:hypothetical protein